MTTDSERRRIIAEARANVADREPGMAAVATDSDPVERWKAEGLAADRARARGREKIRREEQAHVARQAEQPAIDWAAIDRRVERLVEARVQAAIKAMLGAVELVAVDINKAIGSGLDQVEARLASLEEALNQRAARRVNDEQLPARRVN